ncbi:hypothetical protein E2C01_056095 [Portunus trituberculatus]|uniref:Uncharacterized protein n=1 Tax=Portunus trituberculatus TaxID=210409 RepID=A0A5B7GWN4_PORTR|nr:hypothetical protein [Portunus trituberculatus]
MLHTGVLYLRHVQCSVMTKQMALSKNNTASAALEQQAPNMAHKRRITSPSRHEEFPAAIEKRRHSADLPDHRAGG